MSQILGQYCINVSDLERSIRLWQDVFGIPVCSRTEIPGAREAVLQAPEGGSRLQLAQHLERSGPIEMGTALWKLYVNTSDCKGLYAKALAGGCESVRPPAALERWPVTVAFVKDPDGYLIELVEYHGATPPGVPDPKAALR
jgi:lactoylglutathione lyase